MAANYDKYKYSTGTHYIVNSGKDENSGTKGGKAGDQTGHEAELRAWYSRPWTVVLRYVVQIVADTVADLAIDMAQNDKIGYDQNQRTTYWKELQKANYAPSKITTACEEDCTAGVSANVKAAGHIFGIAALENVPICSSRNMRQEFTGAGFIALTASKYLTGTDYLLPGDILLYENHHAATNITVGAKVRNEWHPEAGEAPEPDPDEPDAVPAPRVLITGNVNVRKGPSTDYDTMGVARTGDRLHYFGFTNPENGWLLVEFNHSTGWVSCKYARVDPEPAPD